MVDRLVPVVSLLFLVACDPPESKDEADSADTGEIRDSGATDGCDAGEPDDTFAQARPLDPDDVVAGCVSSGDGAGDPFDTWVLLVSEEPAAGAVVLVTMTGGPTPGSEAGAEFIVTSAEDERPLLDVYVFGDESIEGWFTVSPGASYYVQTTRFGGGGPTLTYDLAIQTRALEDSHEPNQSADEAAPLTVGVPEAASPAAGSARAELAPGDGHDWYVVELAAGSANIAVTGSPSDFACDVELLDTGLARIGEQFADAGGDCVLSSTDLAGGSYFVVVHGFAGEPARAGEGTPPPSVTGTYSLLVTQ